jgi:hypothetical protein
MYLRLGWPPYLNNCAQRQGSVQNFLDVKCLQYPTLEPHILAKRSKIRPLSCCVAPDLWYALCCRKQCCLYRIPAALLQLARGMGARRDDGGMNPTDLSNALVYGIPVVLYAGMYSGFDSILAHRERSPQPESAARAREERWSAVARDDNAALHIAVAKTPEQFASARGLVRQRYAWRGYDLQDPADEPAESRHARSSQEITFLVASGRATVGTLTLGLDGPHGLRAEAAYGDVIEEFRVAGRRVCELTRLALAESVDSKAVLASLFSLAHAVGRTMHDVTNVVIEVNPRHVGFYSRVLGFVVAAGEKFCERVHAPSMLLQLELDALEQRLGLLDVAALMRPMIAEAV